MDLAAMHTHVPHRDPPLQGSTIAHILLSMSRHHHQTILRNEPVMEPNASGGTNWSFFHPVQVHMVEPVQSASVTMNTPSQNAMVPSHGMDLQARPGKTSKADWSQLTVAPSASIGRCHKAVLPQTTPIDTGVQGAEKQVMELKHVLRQRGRNPLTPYCWEAWEAELAQHGLQRRYPKLVQGLKASFDLGIPRIHHSYTLPNHCSISTLYSVYNSIIENEFAASQYISPFTCTQLEASVGPFQMLPLSLVPKTSKPGKYWAVHDFSHPYNPLPAVTSINSSINSDDFPCTWGTFSMVFLLAAYLPPGSQATVHNIAKAYRTIPVAPSQWLGLVIRLQAKDQFAINVCNNFGLTSAGGVYRMVADAGADIFHSCGIGPISKWVDDHIFFRVPQVHLSKYNALRREWRQDIQAHRGHRQSGS